MMAHIHGRRKMNLIEAGLKRPFPVSQIKFMDMKNGRKPLAHIDARNVMDRLDKVVTPAGWYPVYEMISPEIMLCHLSVCLNGVWITKTDGAGESSFEKEKGIISGSLKRSAVLFGIARYLYNDGSFDANRQPAHWATPEGFDEVMAKQHDQSVEEWRASYSEALKEQRDRV